MSKQPEPAQASAAPQDHTLAMSRGSFSPAAPPVAFRSPGYGGAPTTSPPPNVRVRQPSVPAHFSVPPVASIAAPSTRVPAMLGLALFAAPLALATVFLAAIAFM